MKSFRNSRQDVLKDVLKQPATLSKKTLLQVFSGEFWKIYKSTSLEHIWTITSKVSKSMTFCKTYSKPTMKTLEQLFGFEQKFVYLAFFRMFNLTIFVKKLYYRCWKGPKYACAIWVKMKSNRIAKGLTETLGEKWKKKTTYFTTYVIAYFIFFLF